MQDGSEVKRPRGQVRKMKKVDELIEMLADCIIDDIKEERFGCVVEKTKVLTELLSARGQKVTLPERRYR